MGGIGVANAMVIAVFERRRKSACAGALGASRAHTRIRFVGESVLLACIGGAGVAILGGTAAGIVAEHSATSLIVARRPRHALGKAREERDYRIPIVDVATFSDLPQTSRTAARTRARLRPMGTSGYRGDHARSGVPAAPVGATNARCLRPARS